MADNTLTGASIALEQVNSEIVTQTLDKLNSPTTGGKKKSKYSAQAAMSDTYNLSKSVLSAAYEGKGTIIDNSN